MRKWIAFFLAFILVGCLAGVAMAAESITVKITAVDYQTGRAIANKNYVENELFRLKVNITVPRFADIENMQAVVEIAGVEIADPQIAIENGEYYIDGVVIEQPAAVTVKIKDVAIDAAQTAEEMYKAMQQDRTVSATYRFYGAAAAPVQNNALYIPKTGGAASVGIVMLPVFACIGMIAAVSKKK